MTARELERWSAKVDKTAASPCWTWTGSKNSDGYGLLQTGSRTNGTRRCKRAHRIAYEHFIAPIPHGLQLDHLCRRRSCVNPAHLEAVTSRVNSHRSPLTIQSLHSAKTMCVNGHPFTGRNARQRICQICQRDSQRRFRERRRAGL